MLRPTRWGSRGNKEESIGSSWSTTGQANAFEQHGVTGRFHGISLGRSFLHLTANSTQFLQPPIALSPSFSNNNPTKNENRRRASTFPTPRGVAPLTRNWGDKYSHLLTKTDQKIPTAPLLFCTYLNFQLSSLSSFSQASYTPWPKRATSSKPANRKRYSLARAKPKALIFFKPFICLLVLLPFRCDLFFFFFFPFMISRNRCQSQLTFATAGVSHFYLCIITRNGLRGFSRLGVGAGREDYQGYILSDGNLQEGT